MVYNADYMEWIEGGLLNTKRKPFKNIRYRTANSPTNIARINMLLATINNQLWRMDWGTIIWMDKHNNNIDTGGEEMIFVRMYPLFFNMCGGTGTKAHPKRHMNVYIQCRNAMNGLALVCMV